jgi:hypothetical protein
MKRVLPLLLVASTAHAYTAATHMGLTERAALASSMHKRLQQRLGRALGLYDPIALDGRNRELSHRLDQLDREAAAVPERGKLTALGWLVAGAAVEGVPAERTRNHFYDPSRGTGLDEVAGRALGTRLSSAGNGVGSLRGIFTGQSFDGSGMAAPSWLSSRDNEWGLPRFLDELERAVAAPTAAKRDAALARALLAAGAIAHLVEDAGDPTFVRDDYRAALEADDAPYERFVESNYGRVGVPELGGAPIKVLHLLSLFHERDKSGLADRTQARFFSPGTLPDTGRYARPQTAPGAATSGYARGSVPHLVHYRVTEKGTEWSLDQRCYADYARALLPEVGRYAAGTLDLLFRGHVDVSTQDGTATVVVRDVALGRGKLSIYANVGATRRLVDARAINSASDGETIATVPLPAGARAVGVVFRGVDGAAEPVVVVQEHKIN